MSARYRPSPFVVVSIALHAVIAALMLFAAARAYWLEFVLVLALNHAALTLAGLWPKSQLLGQNWIKLKPAAPSARSPQPQTLSTEATVAPKRVAITIDDGPDPAVTPKVLEILHRFNVKATFFCIAQRVEQYPDLARSIVAQGHAIENHSYTHSHAFSLWGPKSLHTDISKAQDTIERIVGRKPVFFRAPAGLRNPFLDYVLQKNQLQLAAWTRRGFDTQSADAGLVFRRLTQQLSDNDILLIHDGNSARIPPSNLGNGSFVIEQMLPKLLAHLRDLRIACVRMDQAAH